MTLLWLFSLGCRTQWIEKPTFEQDSGTVEDTALGRDSGTIQDTSISIDNDDDGYPSSIDCNDDNPSIHPDALDWCGDDIDQNCNGTKDDVICSITTQQMHRIFGTISNGGFGKQVRHLTHSALTHDEQVLISANYTTTGTLYHNLANDLLSHDEDSSLNSIELDGSQMFGTIILEPNTIRNTDINRDGWNDWIISSPTSSNETGQIHIFSEFNRSTPSHSIAWNTGLDVGKSLEVIDWNGDGLLDIVIGDARNSDNGTDAGAFAVHLTSLNPPILSTISSETVVHGEQPSDLFGHTLTNVGDINGDGFQDLAVAALRSAGSNNLYHSGRVVFFLSETGVIDYTPDLFIDGALESGLLGSSIEVLGDINDDGIVDLGIGARTAGGSGTGYVVSTSELMNCSSACTITDISFAELTVSDPDSQFGRSWVPLGDINQDGVDDFGVGAKRANIGAEDTGAMYLYLGPITGNTINRYHGRISGEEAYTQLTVSTTTVDMDGDGLLDIVFGGREERLVELGTIDNGNVYILTHEALFSE